MILTTDSAIIENRFIYLFITSFFENGFNNNYSKLQFELNKMLLSKVFLWKNSSIEKYINELRLLLLKGFKGLMYDLRKE